MKRWCVVAVVLIGVFYCQEAYAYLDPGSGGYLLTALWGYMVGFVVFVWSAAGLFFRNKVLVLFQKHKMTMVLVCVIAGAAFGGMLYQHYRNARNSDLKKLHEYFLYADRYMPSKVICDDPKLSYNGYDYVEGDIYDHHGKIVHSWRKPGFGGYLGVIDTNGDLYASSGDEEGYWGRLTWDGKVVWKKNYPIHHEIVLLKDRLIVFVKEKHEYKGRSVAFDVIRTLDKNGAVLDQWSTWDALADLHRYFSLRDLDVPLLRVNTKAHIDNGESKAILYGADYDYFHLNSLQIIPPNTRQGESEVFKPGNWLISFHHGNVVLILDKDTKKVLWGISSNDIKDGLDGQHGPRMLPDGNILIFDNGYYRLWSRVIEIDPVTRHIVWEYKKPGFFSIALGHAQPLPNGNILVTEGLKGHAFELTKDKKIVWEYYRETVNYPSSYKDIKMKFFRKTVYRLIRYSPQQIEPLLLKQGS